MDEESGHLIDAEVLSKLINGGEIKIGTVPSDLGDVKYYYIHRIFNRQVKIKEDFKKETSRFFVTYNSQITESNLKQNQDKDIVLISDTDNHFDKLCNNKNYEKHNIH